MISFICSIFRSFDYSLSIFVHPTKDFLVIHFLFSFCLLGFHFGFPYYKDFHLDVSITWIWFSCFKGLQTWIPSKHIHSSFYLSSILFANYFFTSEEGILWTFPKSSIIHPQGLRPSSFNLFVQFQSEVFNMNTSRTPNLSMVGPDDVRHTLGQVLVYMVGNIQGNNWWNAY